MKVAASLPPATVVLVSPAAVVLVLMLGSSLMLNVFFLAALWDYEGRLQQLCDIIADLQQENLALKKSVEILEHQLVTARLPLAEEPPLGEWIYIAGVYLEHTEHGRIPKGEMLRLYARFIPGTGRVLITTTPKIGIDLQASAEVAYAVAQRVSGVNASNLDVIITVAANRTIEVIDGPSAGVAMAVLLYAELAGVPLKKEVVATGTVLPDGTVGEVGGIIEKAIAAAELGASTLLVPEGQSQVLTYVKEVRRIGPFTVIRYEPTVVDVEEYLYEIGYEIDVVEISDIYDAIALMTD